MWYDPCFHGFCLFSRIRDVDMWKEGLEARSELPGKSQRKPFGRVEFDQLLGEYRAMCDMLALIFALELIEAYPEAKVVLVEREIESWYKSFNTNMIQPSYNPIIRLVAMLDRRYLARVDQMSKTMFRTYFKADTKEKLMKNARPVYREHNVMVRRMVDKERLLEFKLQDGWEPLCKFLGKPIPDAEFPRLNNSVVMKEKIGILIKASALKLLKDFAMVVGGFVVVLVAIYWHRK